MSEADSLKPRLVLRFGVTGHRPPRFAREHHAAAKETCRAIFSEAQDVLSQLYAANRGLFSDEDPQLRLVSALADGADIVAAEAALEEGMAVAAVHDRFQAMVKTALQDTIISGGSILSRTIDSTVRKVGTLWGRAGGRVGRTILTSGFVS